ncbi:methyltransferase domain-containing protein [Edaphobacter modestus]|uniref:methyltransferase domain-containing protein n=1 Tax=Edaphobacter modestus TaxID=388466 RepID=UPI003BF84CA4
MLLIANAHIPFESFSASPDHPQSLNWWYASPRNGHVSLYTTPSLAHLFKHHGMKVASFSERLHIAYAQVPTFASHLKLPH